MKDREIGVSKQMRNAAQPAQGGTEMPKLILGSRLVLRNTLFLSFTARYVTLCNLDAGGTRWRCHHINVKKLSSLCVSGAAPALELFFFLFFLRQVIGCYHGYGLIC